MVAVFGAERTLGTMQTFDIIVHQLVGGEAAFVRKLLIAFVTWIHHFSISVSAEPAQATSGTVRNFVKLHPMHGSGGKIAALRWTMQHGCGVGVTSGVEAQGAQFRGLILAVVLSTPKWRL